MAISSSLSYLDNAGSGNVTATPGPLTLNYVILGAGANGIKAATNLDDGATTANTLTFTGTAGIVSPIFNAATTSGKFQIAGVTVVFLPGGDTTSIGLGELAGVAQTGTSIYNVALGYSALVSNTTGGGNMAIGGFALNNLVSGQFNVAVGSSTLFSCTGNNNVAIGYNAGNVGNVVVGGSSLVLIGYETATSGFSDTNEISIGASVTGAGSNTAVIGNASITDVYFGSSSPAANVRAAGYYAGTTAGVSAGPFTAVTGITTIKGIVTALSGTSDERLKDWVPYTGGLAEILAITPASYHWNEKGTAQTGLPSEQEYVGFIAQDVQRSIPQAITATEPSRTTDETYLSLDDRPIIACLVNCIKELHERIKVLEAE